MIAMTGVYTRLHRKHCYLAIARLSRWISLKNLIGDETKMGLSSVSYVISRK
ncbi:hypothetical protein [Nostoc sp. CMAA1605]|uniref:hypothetical protein n=1 Tax=Nostoc sp. CMAA1605 TaxID=2055159 RepID=UPI001F261193|nr:hypothetical protein [Nostoc sp. CMAA1605]